MGAAGFYIICEVLKGGTKYAGYAALDVLLNLELIQRAEEGYDTTGILQKLEAAGTHEASLMKVYEEMQDLPLRKDFSFVEPSDLAGIRQDRPIGPRRLEDALWCTPSIMLRS